MIKETHERFWAKVDMNDPEGHWLWTGGKSDIGYGVFWVKGARQGAHRIAYRELVGPIPARAQLHQSCGVRHCVNPEHWSLTKGIKHCDKCGQILRKKKPGAVRHHKRLSRAERREAYKTYLETHDNALRVAMKQAIETHIPNTFTTQHESRPEPAY